jgi:hypothetical protein
VLHHQGTLAYWIVKQFEGTGSVCVCARAQSDASNFVLRFHTVRDLSGHHTENVLVYGTNFPSALNDLRTFHTTAFSNKGVTSMLKKHPTLRTGT